MAKPLRVGIIGASASGGWARESHVPAVQQLAGLTLAGVATRSVSSAQDAARAYDTKGFSDPLEMIGDPSIDVVTIAVKVPDHRALVHAALAAGKHIFCEWPLGANLAEAEELRDATAKTDVHVAIGVQARMCAPARRAAELVGSGAIGRVLAARHYSDTMAFSQAIGKANLYLEDAANGATLLSIHGGHALDLANAVLGPLADVSALTVTQFPDIEITDLGERRLRKVPDRLLATIRLADGSGVGLEVVGGRPGASASMRLEVVGEKATLVLSGGAPRGFQSGRLELAVDGRPQHLDEDETKGFPDTAVNVAAVYAALRDDIERGTKTAPDFDHAVRLTRVLEDVAASSDTGTRRVARDWPTG